MKNSALWLRLSTSLLRCSRLLAGGLMKQRLGYQQLKTQDGIGARWASQDGGLIYNGTRVYFYSDFSLMVMMKCKAYDVLKQRLQERGMPHVMLFPATLQVTQEVHTLSFDSLHG